MMAIYLEENGCGIDVSGLLIYRRKTAGEESARELLNDFRNQKLDFNLCLGAFRVILEDKRNGEKVLFCDNGGNLCFYIDYEKNRFSDSFLELTGQRDAIEPNYQSIAQFLWFGCIYSKDMMCKGIMRTSPSQFYRIDSSGVESLEKKLKPFEELKEYASLHDLMGQLTKSCRSLKTAAVITGGIDSRTILAHLLSLKQRPQLVISGKHTDADVRIASEIAENLRLPLLFIDENPSDENWIREAFEAGDGVCGTFGRYRLHKKSKQLEADGFDMDFGGGAGELYKNSFINQDMPFYGGKANLRKFYRLKVAAFTYPDNLCGEAVREPINHMEETILEQLARYDAPSKYDGLVKYNTYNLIGYYILQQRLITSSNSAAKYCLGYTPLMERDCAALAYITNPYKLEMQAFQRNEVSKYCPEIAGIRTDRGLSCSNKKSTMIFEVGKSYSFLLKVAFHRIFKRKKIVGRSDMTFAPGLASVEYEKAVSCCKRLKIIPETIRKEDIPPAIGDRIMTVGLLFDKTVIQ